MPSIHCEINEINVILTWSANCVITDAELYFPLVTLSTQDKTNHCNSSNQGSNTQLTEININQKHQQKDQINV